MDFEHYKCQCGYLFTIEQVTQLRFDIPCPKCHTPLSEAMHVSAKNTEQSNIMSSSIKGE